LIQTYLGDQAKATWQYRRPHAGSELGVNLLIFPAFIS